MMRSKATKNNPIEVSTVPDILNYFADEYDRLTSPMKTIGAIYLSVELNKGNRKAESYLCGIALGPFDHTRHPMQSWAITTLADFKKRSDAKRKSYVNRRTRVLNHKAREHDIPLC